MILHSAATMTILSRSTIKGLATLAGSTMNKVVVDHPLGAAVGLTSMKTVAADVFAQTLSNTTSRNQEGAMTTTVSSSMDWPRVGVFFLYGALYLGAFQYLLFTKFYPTVFPLATQFATKSWKRKLRDPCGAIAVLQQVLVEAFVHWPFLLVPMYYICQELVVRIVAVPAAGRPAAASVSSSTSSFAGRRARRNRDRTRRLLLFLQEFHTSVRSKLRSNWFDDLKLLWLIWIPSSLCMFSTLPLQWQVPFTSVVSFVYTVVLSLRRGGEGGGDKDDGDGHINNNKSA